jgi:hypothetical protein
VFALASPLALAHVAFWFVPLVAVFLSWSALRRIRDLAPDVSGRGVALVAMVLALIFGLSALLQPLLYNYSMRAQAIETQREWFMALRDKNPAAAYQLTVAKWLRKSAGVSVEKYHARMGPRGPRTQYVDEPAVKMLLLLGKHAQIRFYKHLSLVTDTVAETDRVDDLYEITDGEAADPVPSFIKLTVTRRLDLMQRLRSWEITKAELVDDPSKLVEETSQGIDAASAPGSSAGSRKRVRRPASS